MFKYLQHLHLYKKKNKYVFEVFEEENLITDGWVTNRKTKLEVLGLGNLIENIFKVISGDIPKKNKLSIKT